MATVQIMQALGIKSSEMKDRGNVSVDKQSRYLDGKQGSSGMCLLWSVAPRV